jgi:hypothetical protein
MTRFLKFIKRIRLYLKFYNEPDGRALSAEAYTACKIYYAQRPHLRSIDASIAFQRGYKNSYRRAYAMAKIRSLDIR